MRVRPLIYFPLLLEFSPNQGRSCPTSFGEVGRTEAGEISRQQVLLSNTNCAPSDNISGCWHSGKRMILILVVESDSEDRKRNTPKLALSVRNISIDRK
jgi:hypothetical protein